MEAATNFKQFATAAKISRDDQTRNITHTRIGSRDFGIAGGSYEIPPHMREKWWRLYYQHVFVHGDKEYLTERQLSEGGPILIDLDFRYPYAIDQRLHNEDDIHHILGVYLDELEKMFEFDAQDIPIYVMEKRNVNRVAESDVTKDGIHIIIGLQVDTHIKLLLRNKVLQKLGPHLTRLPLQNSLDDVVDRGVALGTTNWQMYGSRKPNNQPYELTYRYTATVDPEYGNFIITECEDEFNLERNLFKLSAQYPDHVAFPLRESFRPEYDLAKAGAVAKTSSKFRRATSGDRLHHDDEEGGGGGGGGGGGAGASATGGGSSAPTANPAEVLLRLDQIRDSEVLAQQMMIILRSLRSDEHHVKETHEYTQILPEKFFRPGSHDLNTKIAFALKNTDERLFLSWVMLRSKAEDFDYAEIPALKRRWDHGLTSNRDGEVLTRRTIMYYAKQENPSEFHNILLQSRDYYVQKSLKDGSDWDLAMVVYQIYKDKYLCISVKNQIWYTYKDHRWVQDKGNSIRKLISVEVHAIYDRIKQARFEEFRRCNKEFEKIKKRKNNNEEEFEEKKEEAENKKQAYNIVAQIVNKLKSCGNKNNILTEAATLFFDEDFIEKADSKTTLLCFTNGVWDFSEGVQTFRPGLPQDYLTKCTHVAFVPEEERHPSMVAEITTFFHQLFPTPGLNRYMWDHLASCLVGGNKNQTFNIYLGSGSNGKSKLTALMSHCFGDYKGTVPITLVTQKRGEIGGTSSEVVQLKGVRYAVMQEPTKNNCTLNEGVMKEITGGDPITARGLYKDSETFTPQLNLVVCSNILFDINSTDEGTWRRIRVCRFMSKFVDNLHGNHDIDPRFLFPKDYDLEAKLKNWASTFISMLVSRYLLTNGAVAECEEVLEESRKYQQGQDLIALFLAEKIMVLDETQTASNRFPVNKTGLFKVFKDWIKDNYPDQKAPKSQEVQEVFEKKFHKYPRGGWKNFAIKDEGNEDGNEAAADSLL